MCPVVAYTGVQLTSTSYAELYTNTDRQGVVVRPPSQWLQTLSLPGALETEPLAMATKALQQALRDAIGCGTEALLQEALMDAFMHFVGVASEGKIVLHDTHKRRFLAGLKPDITGTSTNTTRASEVEPAQSVLTLELRLGDALDSPAVLGQIMRYGMELCKARVVDGPVTVGVMNATHILFLRVSDAQVSRVWVSGKFHLLDRGAGESNGVFRLLEYVLECKNMLAEQEATAWGKRYVILRHLGSGVSARAHVARARDGKSSKLVVIKVFNKATGTHRDEVERDCAPSPSRDPPATDPHPEVMTQLTLAAVAGMSASERERPVRERHPPQRYGAGAGAGVDGGRRGLAAGGVAMTRSGIAPPRAVLQPAAPTPQARRTCRGMFTVASSCCPTRC
jgi:hypothetical protein